jgi:hypothetical protein
VGLHREKSRECDQRDREQVDVARAQIGEYASEIGGAVLGLEARRSKIAQNPPRHHRKSGAGQQHRSSEPSDDRSTGS